MLYLKECILCWPVWVLTHLLAGMLLYFLRKAQFTIGNKEAEFDKGFAIPVFLLIGWFGWILYVRSEMLLAKIKKKERENENVDGDNKPGTEQAVREED